MQGFNVACYLLFRCLVIGYGLRFGQTKHFFELQKTYPSGRNAEVRFYVFQIRWFVFENRMNL